MSMLCIDKTGTLTENRLAVNAVATIGAADREEILRWASLASDASTQDPIDLAILAAGGAAVGDRSSFTPFDPSTKRSQAAVVRGGRTIGVAKGAPHVIAAMAGEQPPAELSSLASGGARVLAVAIDDGVNDAPALRQAEVGIAMEGATDVAKSAAGVVLVRGGLTDIVGLIEESRRIHQRSLTYALNVSVKKLEVPLLLTASVLSFGQLVFTPLLMALLLLANDVVSMMITTDNAVYSQKPNTWNVGRTIAGALVVATPMLGSSLAVLWASGQLWPGGGIDQLRTVIFLTLVFSSQITTYVVRTDLPAWKDRPSGS